MIENML